LAQNVIDSDHTASQGFPISYSLIYNLMGNTFKLSRTKLLWICGHTASCSSISYCIHTVFLQWHFTINACETYDWVMSWNRIVIDFEPGLLIVCVCVSGWVSLGTLRPINLALFHFQNLLTLTVTSKLQRHLPLCSLFSDSPTNSQINIIYNDDVTDSAPMIQLQ